MKPRHKKALWLIGTGVAIPLLAFVAVHFIFMLSGPLANAGGPTTPVAEVACVVIYTLAGLTALVCVLIGVANLLE